MNYLVLNVDYQNNDIVEHLRCFVVVDELWGLSVNPGGSALIGCTVSTREPVGVEMQWSRHGQPLDLETNPHKYNVSVVNFDDSTTRLVLTVNRIGMAEFVPNLQK